MDWGDLRFLLAVRERGSFSKAARVLGVDQATVSRRIAALQRALGTPLVEHAPGGSALTPAGEEAVRAAREMREAADGLELRLAGASRRATGKVRITLPDTVAACIVAPRLGELRRAHPELDVELLASSGVLNLLRREADLALRLLRPAEPTVAARKVGALAFAVYASREYLLRRKLTAQAPLAAHELVAYDAALATGTPHGRWLEEAASGARFALRTNSSWTLLAAARAGAGAALLPCFMGDPAPELTRVVAPSQIPAPDLWLAVHRELRSAARIRAASVFLASVVSEAGPLLRGLHPG